MRIAVTGATGYIGGRLIPLLIAEGHDVVCLARTPEKLADRPWFEKVEIKRSDILDVDSVSDSLAGCEIAYYLVHSMGSDGDFVEMDNTAAINFATAAAEAGVARIIYLGGLGTDAELSRHLSSRHEVGQALASENVPVTEFRAAVIIGSGSVSFEMLRSLTQVLPAMTTPKWVRTLCQPIAIRDVLTYLAAAIGEDSPGHTVYEIGGPDVLTYEEMMQTYAEVAGLPKRLIIPVPVLSPGLSSLWIGLVTPLPINIARPLVDSLKHEVVVHDLTATDRFGLDLIGFRQSVELAVEVADGLDPPTRWSDAEASSPARPMASDPSWSGETLFEERRTLDSHAEPDDLYWAFSRIGGDVGYYGFSWAWKLRGLIDTMVGGVGLRRGRRHPNEIRPGDAIDFWRVAGVEPGSRLELVAEMKLPGRAWLAWTAEATSDGSTLMQEAFFEPRGLLGRVYWWALTPLHGPIFRRMARRIVDTAEERAGATPPPVSTN